MQKAMFTRVCAILAIGAGVIFAAMSGEAAPRYQAEMSVSGYTGTETLANFPVLVRISADKISGFEYGQCLATDGSDISFVDAEGNVLSHEVDTWDTAGESTVWVRIPSLAKGTTFTMRWGDASPAAQTAANTWNVNYVGVWHMGEASGTCANSSQCGSKYDAEPVGNATSASVRYAGTDAPVGYARQTAAASGTANAACLSVPSYDDEKVGGVFTMSGWVYMPSYATQWPRLFARVENWNVASGWECQFESSATKLQTRGSGSYSSKVVATVPTWIGKWTHFVFTYNGTACAVYVNGLKVTTTGSMTVITDNGLPLGIGCIPNSNGFGTGGSHVVGSFDECRLMKGAASSDWVAAEYAAVTSADFVTAGPAGSTLKATANVADGAWQGVDLTFAAASEDRTLTVKWGATSADLTGGSATVTVAANATSLSYTALPEGWGTTVKAIQFGFEDAGHWSDVIEWFSTSAPIVGAVTLDGMGGDTIVVKGQVTSFPGAECVVKAYWGTSAGALEEWQNVSQTLNAAGAFELTLMGKAIEPGTIYYVQVVATADGCTGKGETVYVTTAGAAKFGSTPTVSISRRTATVKGYVSDLGMNGKTTVALWAREKGSTGEYVQVGDGKELTATGEFTFSVALEKFCQTYEFEVRATNGSAGGMATAAAEGSSGEITTVDTTTYRWSGKGGDGKWENKENWDPDPKDCFGWPSSSGALAAFEKDTVAVVTLDGSYSLWQLYLSNTGTDITLRRGESAAEMPVITASVYGYESGSILGKVTLDGVKIAVSGSVSVGAGAQLTLQNAAEVTAAYGNFDCYGYEAGGTVCLRGKSKIHANWVNLGPCTLEIDDSTFEMAHGTWLCVKGTNVTTTIRFVGENPIYRTGGSYFCVGKEDWSGFQGVMEFVVPAGGYKEAPFQAPSNKSLAFGENNNSSGKFYGQMTVKIAKDSPLFSRLSTGTELETPLISWVGGGISTTFLSGCEAKKGEFVWGEAASNGNPLTLGYKVKGGGMVIRIQ